MRRKISMSGMIGAAAVALPGVLASAPGWAQAIEEMVVTTRRKEESLQEVPISVSAISSEEITRLGITNAKGVAKYTPGIELTSRRTPCPWTIKSG